MSSNQLVDNILLVCKALHKHSVEYMIVGGTAVGFYGYYRQSTSSDGTLCEKEDLDFWYNPNYANYFKLLNALEELEIDVSRFKEEQTPDPIKSFFKYEFEAFTLDFLPIIAGHPTFGECYRRREISTMTNIELAVIALDDLIASKKISARKKDIDDINKLLEQNHSKE